SCRSSRQGQGEAKRASLALDALHFEPGPLPRQDLHDQRHPEPRATDRPRLRGIDPEETLAESAHGRFGHPDAGVADLDLHTAVEPRPDHDVAAAAVVLHRVVDEVRKPLLDLIAI